MQVKKQKMLMQINPNTYQVVTTQTYVCPPPPPKPKTLYLKDIKTNKTFMLKKIPSEKISSEKIKEKIEVPVQKPQQNLQEVKKYFLKKVPQQNKTPSILSTSNSPESSLQTPKQIWEQQQQQKYGTGPNQKFIFCDKQQQQIKKANNQIKYLRPIFPQQQYQLEQQQQKQYQYQQLKKQNQIQSSEQIVNKDILQQQSQDIIIKKVKIENIDREVVPNQNQNKGQKKRCAFQILEREFPLNLEQKSEFSKKDYKSYQKLLEKHQQNYQQHIQYDESEQLNQIQQEYYSQKQETVINLYEDLIPCSVKNCKFQSFSRSVYESHMKNIHHLKIIFEDLNTQSVDQTGCESSQFNKDQCSKTQEKEYSQQENELLQENEYSTEEISDDNDKENSSQEQEEEEGNSDKVYSCIMDECDFKTKSKKSCQQHAQNSHCTSIFHCPVSGCDFYARNKAIIYNHQKNIHENSIMLCNLDGCYFKAKNYRSMQNHLRNKHKIKKVSMQKVIIDTFKQDQLRMLKLIQEKEQQQQQIQIKQESM